MMVRLAALALTVLTGFSGLVYEVAWQRYLATLLGSHGEATAAILAIFLGGLSAGYALFGRLTRRRAARARAGAAPLRLLRAYGGVEAGIGAWALGFPILFGVAQRVSLLVPLGHPGLGFAFDVALSSLLLGPPAVLMGGTIPMLTLALAGDLERATRVHAWIYGFNTLGAFAGALAAGFWIVPHWGLDGAVRAMGAVNLVAGGAFALLDRFGPARVAELPAEEPPAGSAARFRAYAAVALLSGFAMMAIQTILNRIGALALGSSNFTFAMVVAAFVLCIALGSLAVSALPRVPSVLLPAVQWLLVALLCLLYFAVPDAPYAAHVLRSLFQSVAAAFYPFHFFVFLCLLGVWLLPIGLSGALLPLLFDRLRREGGGLGSVAGRLYAWNTVGSLLGALLGGYVLLFWLDLEHVWRAALLALAAGAALSLVLVARLPAVAGAGCFLVPALAVVFLLPPWSPMRLTAGLFRVRTAAPATYLGADAFFAQSRHGPVLFYRDDPTGTVSVAAGGPDAEDKTNRSIVVNGKSDGNLASDYPTTALLALLPAALADRDERCFVIGLGTGVTVGELAALHDTREVEVAEISRGVIEAAPLFAAGNLGGVKSPKVRLRRGDAYRTLLQSPERFDVIVSEPSNPWVTGVEMLYSVEFLEAARAHLAPGGVYAQWFHSYEIDKSTVDLVLRNYASVFPSMSVWFTLASDLVLLGFDRSDRALDVAGLEERLRRPDFLAGFERAGIRSFPALLAHEILPLGVVRAEALPGPLHTLRHPILSDDAARAFFVGGDAVLPRFVMPAEVEIGTRNSLLRRLAGASGPELSEDLLEAAASESCRAERNVECATFFARWKHDAPDSPRLARALSAARNGRNAAAMLGDDSLDSVAELFDDPGRLPAVQRPLVRAKETSERFLSFFHHAIPFERRALEAAWRDCRYEACAIAQKQAERTLGPIGGKAGPRAKSVP